jgi:hypothetical protein
MAGLDLIYHGGWANEDDLDIVAKAAADENQATPLPGQLEPVGKSARRYSEQMLRLGDLHQFIAEIRISEAHQRVDALGR